MSMEEEIGFYGWPDRDTWFDSLQPGDEVIVERRMARSSELKKTTVKAITPQGKVRIANGDMYDKWCRIIIGYYHSYHIRPVTDVEQDELERQYFIKRISALQLEEIDLETLRRLYLCIRKKGD